MTDFGSIWKTIREVDILAIRHEAEHDVIVACVGDPAALEHVRVLLLRWSRPVSAAADRARAGRVRPGAASGSG